MLAITLFVVVRGLLRTTEPAHAITVAWTLRIHRSWTRGCPTKVSHCQAAGRQATRKDAPNSAKSFIM